MFSAEQLRPRTTAPLPNSTLEGILRKRNKRGIGRKRRFVRIDGRDGSLGVYKGIPMGSSLWGELVNNEAPSGDGEIEITNTICEDIRFHPLEGEDFVGAADSSSKLSISEATFEDSDSDDDNDNNSTSTLATTKVQHTHFPASTWTLAPALDDPKVFTVYASSFPFPHMNGALQFRVKDDENERAKWIEAAGKLGCLVEGTNVRRLSSAIKEKMPLKTERDDAGKKKWVRNYSSHPSRTNSNGESEFRLQGIGWKGFGGPDEFENDDDKWCTHAQLLQRSSLPTEDFVDYTKNKGINEFERAENDLCAIMNVEVLQCTGLPKLDALSRTDPYVVLIFGNNAFKSTVIEDCFSPVWLPHNRRGARFPVYSLFTRLYVGVWDDDGPLAADDFAGRAQIEVGKLDFTKVMDACYRLRTSSVAYSRSPRGLIRLRISFTNVNKKARLLSIAKPPPPARIVLTDRDSKATRIVTYTIFGRNPPGV